MLATGHWRNGVLLAPLTADTIVAMLEPARALVRMKIFLNGEQREVGDATTVAELVAESAGPGAGRGVAVAVDAEVVPRSAWQDTELTEGQRVELLAAIQGG